MPNLEKVGLNWPGEVAAIWARLHYDRPDDAETMAFMLTTQEQRVLAMQELNNADREEDVVHVPRSN